jgi:hypothetical protein
MKKLKIIIALLALSFFLSGLSLNADAKPRPRHYAGYKSCKSKVKATKKAIRNNTFVKR